MLTVSMRSTSSRAVVLAVLAVAVPGCNVGKTCTEIGCISGAGLHADFPSNAATLSGQTASVCRNTECYAAVIPAPSEAGTGRSFWFARTTTVVEGTLWNNSDQTSGLGVFWRLPNDSPALQSADRYVLGLTDAAGVMRLVFDKTTTSYEKLSPNGDDCGPICWRAIFPP